MNSTSARRRVATSAALYLGLASLPLGCASTQELASEPARLATESPAAPEATVAQLTLCAEQGVSRLSDTHYAIVFDVQVTEDGTPSEATVRDSMISDKGIQSCMKYALQGMSVPSSVMAMRASGRVSQTMIPLQSRAPMGNVLVLGGAINLIPIVIVAAGVTIVVAITIEIISSTSRRDPAPDEAEKERCKKVLDMCIEKCTDEAIPSGSLNGDPFFYCRRLCLEAQNCW